MSLHTIHATPATPADLAREFWSMGSDGQADFFMSLALIIQSESSQYRSELQWFGLANELEALPDAARDVLMSMAAPHYLHTLRAAGEPV